MASEFSDLVVEGKPGIMFRSLPDNRRVLTSIGENGQPQSSWENVLVLTRPMIGEISKHANDYWHPQKRKVNFEGFQWLVNTLTDVDTYRGGLTALDDTFSAKAPIFNHPRAIAMTRRDISSKLLSGIEGLIVPKCIRINPTSIADFEKAMEREGITYPVLVRPVALQTAQGLIKVDRAEDWQKFPISRLNGSAQFMTQFVDFENEDGGYIRARLAFVGDTVLLRGFTRQPSWLITRAWGDAPTKADIDLFMDEVGRFPEWQELIRASAAVIRRGHLDFWGMDVGIIDRKTFVLFEANAAMSILDPYGMSDEVLERTRDYFMALSSMACKHMLSPENWKSDLAMKFPPVSVSSIYP